MTELLGESNSQTNFGKTTLSEVHTAGARGVRGLHIIGNRPKMSQKYLICEVRRLLYYPRIPKVVKRQCEPGCHASSKLSCPLDKTAENRLVSVVRIIRSKRTDSSEKVLHRRWGRNWPRFSIQERPAQANDGELVAVCWWRCRSSKALAGLVLV